MSRKYHLIDINIKIYYIYIYMLLPFKFNSIPYQKEKKYFFWIIKFIYMFTPI